jgi:hypothetical protein
MLTDKEHGITVEAVTTDLEELEQEYRIMRRRLRALLAVLQAEAATEGKGDE